MGLRNKKGQFTSEGVSNRNKKNWKDPEYRAARMRALDEGAFKKESPDRNYWVGLLMADGNVSGDRLVRLCLKDKDHVEKFKEFLSSGHKIGVRNRPEIKKKYYELQISSKGIASDLNKLGVTPRKSFTAKAPQSLLSDIDFWRGVIDGDGSFGVYNTTLQLKLVGSKNLVTQFRTFALQEVLSRASVRKRENIWCFTLSGKAALHTLERLYAKSGVALSRKLDKAGQIIETAHKEA